MYLIEKFKMDAPVKPPRILGGHSKKIEKFEKFSQKKSGHQSDNSNHNSHWISYFS